MEKRERELRGPGRGLCMSKDSRDEKHICTLGVVNILM